MTVVHTVDGVAKIYGVSTQAIRLWLERFNIQHTKVLETNWRLLSEENIEEIAMNLQKITKKYDLHIANYYANKKYKGGTDE